MRVLVACPECKRQYDASELTAGDRFRCLCGETLETPTPQSHEAAVVRCTSCGAPRQDDSPSCRFCSADFTVHERDLHTICPSCMARVSDRARYCPQCATRLLPTDTAGRPSTYRCPACGSDKLLTSRRLGDPGIGILECPVCAGLWLAHAELDLVLRQARTDSSWTAGRRPAESASVDPPVARPPQERGLYRPCPICQNLMHRQNFGRKSGVIVDLCASHGLWFDANELDQVLGWIRRGGEVDAARVEQEEERAAARHRELARQLEPRLDESSSTRWDATGGLDLLVWVLSRVFHR